MCGWGSLKQSGCCHQRSSSVRLIKLGCPSSKPSEALSPSISELSGCLSPWELSYPYPPISKAPQVQYTPAHLPKLSLFPGDTRSRGAGCPAAVRGGTRAPKRSCGATLRFTAPEPHLLVGRSEGTGTKVSLPLSSMSEASAGARALIRPSLLSCQEAMYLGPEMQVLLPVCGICLKYRHRSHPISASRLSQGGRGGHGCGV